MVQGVPVTDGRLINTNPATGEVISRFECTTSDQLNGIVNCANEAQQSWSQVSIEERMAMLRRALKELEKEKTSIAKLIVQEMGKPIEEAEEEMDGAVNKDEYLDILEASLQPKKYGKKSVVVRQPLGCVAVISPWNFPCDEICLLTLPALASGNTVIVKPSEVVPETGAAVVRALSRALPANVLQLASGDGTVGAQLVSHDDVHFIAMTGSSATGKKIVEKSAQQLKRLVLELGGKDPFVVFNDADLDKAASDAVAYSLCNTGQVCCSVERIFVADSVYDDFCKRVATEAATYKVGNGMDPANNVGPMVSSKQRDLVKGQVDDAVEKGAKLLHQSEIPADAPPGSSFFPVTVVAGVSEDMRMYREETFGPVVALTPFDGTEKAAIQLANDSEYGLSGSVYSKDLVKAQRVADKIEAGQVGVNCWPLEHMDVACPWVGHKQSGFGYHSGVEGFHNFSIPKTIVVAPSK